MFPSSPTLSALPLFIVLCLLTFTRAQRIPFTRVSKVSPEQAHGRLLLAQANCAKNNATCSQATDLLGDGVYVSDITIGGKQYSVQLNTGSEDLWINASQIPIPDQNIQLLKGVFVSDVYADGSNLAGEIGFTEVDFHGYKVTNQSINYATIALNNTLSDIFNGIIGLGLNNLSAVHNKLRDIGSGFTSDGDTFLSNVFSASPDLDPFIAFYLQRENDLKEGFEGINQQTKLQQLPANSSCWSFAVDAITVSGKNITLPPSSSASAPPSTLVGIFDTGASSLLASDSLVDAYFSLITGANKIPGIGYQIPCTTVPPSLALTIGGQNIPIHPLDLNSVARVFKTGNGSGNESLVSVCGGGLVGSSLGPKAGFDLLLGDVFLKNVYSLFNFGSPQGSNLTSTTSNVPFLQLLALTSDSTSESDFTNTRSKQLALAPEASADQLKAILGGDPSFIPVDIPVVGGSSGGNSTAGGGSLSGNTSGTAPSWSIRGSFVGSFVGSLVVVASALAFVLH